MNSIYHVLDLGPIVAKDEDQGLLVTINGSYLNLWNQQNGSTVDWECIDCRSFSEI